MRTRWRGKGVFEMDKDVYGGKEQAENLFRQWAQSGERFGIKILVEPDLEEVVEDGM